MVEDFIVFFENDLPQKEFPTKTTRRNHIYVNISEMKSDDGFSAMSAVNCDVPYEIRCLVRDS